MYLPDVRLGARRERLDRRRYAFAVLAGVRGTSAAVRLVRADTDASRLQKPERRLRAAADRVQSPEPHPHDHEQAAAVSALGFDNMRTRAPVRPGDKLCVRATITGARHSNSHADCGILELYSEMYNQDETVVFSLNEAFLVKRRNTEDAA